MTFLNLNVVRTRPESSFDAKCAIGALNVASAIEAIKDHFNLTSWTGDPCVRTPYQWTICTTDPSPSQDYCCEALQLEFDRQYT
jgi:hypothetical protein